MIKKIAENVGGRIEVEHQVNVGSIYIVFIPNDEASYLAPVAVVLKHYTI